MSFQLKILYGAHGQGKFTQPRLASTVRRFFIGKIKPVVTEQLTLEGNLLDENRLSKVLDVLNRHGVKFRVNRLKVGGFADEPSLIHLFLTAPDLATMKAALAATSPFGATYSMAEVILATAEQDGVLPEDFYSTTNFSTSILHLGEWLSVENIEMDCGIRVISDESGCRAETCPMHQVHVGDELVIGFQGVRVTPQETEQRDDSEFRFMSNDVSSERPKGRMIRHAAEVMQASRAEGKKTLFVGGPAIVHSGSAPFLAALIENGWVDILFAGNALAAHDIEASMLGTSLGVDVETGISSSHGHTHHLRVINRIRRCGSIEAAVEQGLITTGVMYTCVKTSTPYVLCGSIRDDGPLPGVYTDNVEGQDAMRRNVGGVGVCLMVATMLHSIATGNMLPASVKTFCVDSDADTVIKLTDRGTHQAIGLVTDCEFFLKELCSLLKSLPKSP